MLLKIHDSYRKIIALCDNDLLGKTFSEGKIELSITENFFNGSNKDYNEIIEILNDMSREDATFNIIGKESIKAALKCEIIKEHGISYVEGIPFALVLM